MSTETSGLLLKPKLEPKHVLRDDSGQITIHNTDEDDYIDEFKDIDLLSSVCSTIDSNDNFNEHDYSALFSLEATSKLHTDSKSSFSVKFEEAEEWLLSKGKKTCRFR